MTNTELSSITANSKLNPRPELPPAFATSGSVLWLPRYAINVCRRAMRYPESTQMLLSHGDFNIPEP